MPAVSLPLRLTLAVPVYVLGSLSLSTLCSHFLCPWELLWSLLAHLLVHCMQFQSIIQSSSEVAGDGWFGGGRVSLIVYRVKSIEVGHWEQPTAWSLTVDWLEKLSQVWGVDQYWGPKSWGVHLADWSLWIVNFNTLIVRVYSLVKQFLKNQPGGLSEQKKKNCYVT